MKKLFFLLATIAIMGIILTACGDNKPNISNELDIAVGKAILDDNENLYGKGECIGEGHIILGTETKDNSVIVYALTMYGEYGFENGVFTKISGSGTIPATLNFDVKDGEYNSIKVIYPQDGSYYQKSINEMFPTKYRSRALRNSDIDYKKLKLQEEKYAQDYLKSIGRTAQILEYGDFEHVLLTDKGISVEISNKVPGKNLGKYPHWIGTREEIENGIRVVYELSYNENDKYIVFRKYEYETKKEIEIIKYDAITGQRE